MTYFVSFPEQIEKVGDDPLVNLLLRVGGWPVVHAQWNRTAQSAETLLGSLRGSSMAPVVIGMMVATDDKNSSVRIIQVNHLTHLCSY